MPKLMEKKNKKPLIRHFKLLSFLIDVAGLEPVAAAQLLSLKALRRKEKHNEGDKLEQTIMP